VRSFGATIVVSPFEAATLAGLVPDAADRIFSISNGVDLERFNPAEIYPHPLLDRRAIVMTGAMDYWPNVEGAAWFANHVLPRVLDRAPDARFYVVGSNPAREVRVLAGPHVTVTGRVKDIRPYLAHAAVAVAPLRISRGVQNKVLEAMAMARPVVATREATRALQVTSGNELWVENDPDRFATAIVTALSAPEAKDVAARGRGYVERSHNWSRNLAALDLLLENVTGRTALPACESTTIDSGGRIHRPMMSEAPLAGAE
jgi:sugar transferase (PEP-CTERM/EpsH1 system associated)